MPLSGGGSFGGGVGLGVRALVAGGEMVEVAAGQAPVPRLQRGGGDPRLLPGLRIKPLLPLRVRGGRDHHHGHHRVAAVLPAHPRETVIASCVSCLLLLFFFLDLFDHLLEDLLVLLKVSFQVLYVLLLVVDGPLKPSHR